MLRLLVDAMTAKGTWKLYECVGGPHDGLVVRLSRRARNVILIDRKGTVSEYLDMSVDKLSPVIVAPHVVGAGVAKLPDQIVYSGWLTQEELDYAKRLADKAARS